MLSSMTGYGRAEFTEKNITAVAELRSVNNRFLEVSARLPRSLSVRENEVKELIRKKILRGKINATVTVEHSNGGSVPLRINVEAAKEVYKLLNRLRRSTGMKEKIKIDHLLHFSEVIEQEQVPEADEQEWTAAREAIEKAVNVEIDKKLIRIEEPIKMTGSHTVEVHLKQGTNASVKIEVEKEEE